MTLEQMDALGTRVRGLVELIQELKRAKATLERELRVARERLIEQEERVRRWERERGEIRSRIEKVLGELDLLEHMKGSKEVALD
jgi:chromosome segregation ATPase